MILLLLLTDFALGPPATTEYALVGHGSRLPAVHTEAYSWQIVANVMSSDADSRPARRTGERGVGARPLPSIACSHGVVVAVAARFLLRPASPGSYRA